MNSKEIVSVPRALAERISNICMFTMYKEDWQALSEILAKPAEQHQGEPVALPERKITNVLNYHAALGAEGWNACLDEIAKLGPLYPRPVQGEPVAYLCKAEGAKWLQYGSKVGDPWKPGEVQVTPLYTHDDPGDADDLLAATSLDSVEEERDSLRARLAERDALLAEIAKRHWSGVDFDLPADLAARIKALSASAEPGAPVEIDDQIELAAHCLERGIPIPRSLREYLGNSSAPVERDELTNMVDAAMVEMAGIHPPLKRSECERLIRAALERNPSNDIPDFTPGNGNKAERRATELVAQLQADLTARDERIDELESQLMPDLHSRPEERGTPEAEPCSGCGTPGWTGACNKCIPY